MDSYLFLNACRVRFRRWQGARWASKGQQTLLLDRGWRRGKAAYKIANLFDSIFEGINIRRILCLVPHYRLQWAYMGDWSIPHRLASPNHDGLTIIWQADASEAMAYLPFSLPWRYRFQMQDTLVPLHCRNNNNNNNYPTIQSTSCTPGPKPKTLKSTCE